MTEQRPRARTQHTSEAVTLQRQIGVPDREDAPMQPMPPPRFRRPLYLPMGVTELPQLTNRDNAMLSISQIRQPLPSW